MSITNGLLQAALRQELQVACRQGLRSAERPEAVRAAREAALSRLRSERYAHIMGHERAHQSAAGAYGGGIVIDYDRNGIAVSGHVPIHMPSLDPHSPEAAYNGFATIRNAALAPGDPSGADKSIASLAATLMGKAKLLMDQKKLREQMGG
jgi:hypothetical protein